MSAWQLGQASVSDAMRWVARGAQSRPKATAAAAELAELKDLKEKVKKVRDELEELLKTLG